LSRKINHIGIAVQNLSAALNFYQSTLGLEVHEIETVPEQKVRVAMLPLGESRLELLETTEADAPIAKFISKRGEGIHHICIEVEDIAAELIRLKAAGVRLIDEEARAGAGGCLVAFIHPASTAGVLLELSQQPKQTSME
jgi:methylmalonyl-CoA/ethylmalonyl-CoA epimerase